MGHPPGEVLVRTQLVARDGRRGFRPEERDDDDPQDVEPDQGEAWNERPGEEVADRYRLGGEVSELALRFLVGVRDLIPEHHQHDGWGNDLPEGSRGGDGAAGELRIVAAPQHGRQREEPHRHHGGPDDAGGRGEQCSHHAHGDAEPTAQGAEQHPHGVEQLLGHLRALEHHAHVHEQRHRDQHLVRHHSEDAIGKEAEERRREEVEGVAGEPEEERDPGEAERHREAEHERGAHPREHHHYHQLVCGHRVGSSSIRRSHPSTSTPARVNTHRTASATP